MKSILNKSIWWFFALMCIAVGLYPAIYFLIDRHFGLLSSKSGELLSDPFWNIGFYGHIVLGGVALLIGWTQFSNRLRRKRMNVHRTLGKIYILSVLISGFCGVYIAQFATGGLSNTIGFSLSGLIWVSTTLLAYRAIREGKTDRHQNFMIYSYAVCFSAVTLRIWLPLLTSVFGEFNTAYLIVGWLSWVPNLGVAWLIINRKKKRLASQVA